MKQQMMGFSNTVKKVLPEEIPLVYDDAKLSEFKAPLEEWLPDTQGQAINLEALHHLVSQIDPLAERSDSERNDLDGLLAPHVHAALRVSRRVASSPEFWRWIAIEHAQPLVHARFANYTGVKQWRYTGKLDRNAISRLWWAAEMTRDGGDYSLVRHAFGRTRTAQFALELAYSHHKAAAMAFVKVAEGLDGGVRLEDSRMNRLSVVINALLSIHVLEAFDLDKPDFSHDIEWWDAEPPTNTKYDKALPLGPQDQYVEKGSLSALTQWFRILAGGEELAGVGLHEIAHRRLKQVPNSSLVKGSKAKTPDSSEVPADKSGLESDSDRYTELPLPPEWKPILMAYAPGDEKLPAFEPVDVSRVYDAFQSASLDARDRKILLLRFLGGRTLQKIGERFGISRERVRQIIDSGLQEVVANVPQGVSVGFDLLRTIAKMSHTSSVAIKRTAKHRFSAALAANLGAPTRILMREKRGVLYLLGEKFHEVIKQVEQEVVSRVEFASPGTIAVSCGVSESIVNVVLCLSDKLYLDRAGRIGTRSWTKEQQLQIVAWILALAPDGATTWHVSELVEALKVVFPEDFTNWRALHAHSVISRPGFNAFSHIGKAGHWALAEAIKGAPNTLLEVTDILTKAALPLSTDEILEKLRSQGRSVARASLYALLTNNPRFTSVGTGHFRLSDN